MKRLICTVGLPRSGKSTWAKQQGYTIVNPDSFRLAIYGRRYWAPGERLVWASVDLCVRALFIGGVDTIILDATNTTRSQRDQWRSGEWDTYFYNFPTSADECKKRAIESGQDDLIPIIDRMVSDFEPLGKDEPIWDAAKVLKWFPDPAYDNMNIRMNG